MKKSALMLAIVASLFCGNTMAQAGGGGGTADQVTPAPPATQGRMPKRSPGERATFQASRLTEELGLSAAVKEQVVALFTKRNQTIDELRAAMATDPQGARMKIKDANQQAEAGLKSILSADQYQKYLSMQANRKMARRERPFKQGGADQLPTQ